MKKAHRIIASALVYLQNCVPDDKGCSIKNSDGLIRGLSDRPL